MATRALTRTALQPLSDAGPVADLLVNKHSSATSQADLIHALAVIAHTKPSTCASVVTAIPAWLHSDEERVRADAILLLGTICGSDVDLETLAAFVADDAPRVRAAALRALLSANRRGRSLDVRLYESACESLRNHSQAVRMEAMQLIWVLGNLYAQYTVSSGQSLVDDAFNRICDMTTDSFVAVRAMACRLLGSLHNVSGKHLEQTLHKNVIETDETTMATEGIVIDSSAGAFVHGLEDEFMEVRAATIDSMTELALRSDKFAAASVEFIVDMFNDEVDEVRVMAIHSLRRLGTGAHLSEDLLAVALSALDDQSVDVRTAVHEFLGATRLSSTSAVHQAILALIAAIKRCPSDESTILQALRDLGRRHAAMCEFLTNEVLKIDTNFMTAELTLDDMEYFCGLIVIGNAATVNAHIEAILPAHIQRHLLEVNRRHPHLMTDPLQSAVLSAPSDRAAVRSVAEVLKQTTALLQRAASQLQLLDTRTVLDACKQDLRRVSALDASSAATADFFAICVDWYQQYVVARNSTGATALSAIGRLRLYAAKLACLFSGLSSQSQVFVRQLRIIAMAMEQLHGTASVNLAKYFHDISEFCMHQQVSCPYAAFVTDQSTDALQQLVDQPPPVSPSIPTMLKRRSAEMQLPVSNPHNPANCTARLPMATRIEAILYHVDPTQVRVLVSYPDASTELHGIYLQDVRPTAPYTWRLQTDCMLTLPAWTDVCAIGLTLVMLNPDDDTCLPLAPRVDYYVHPRSCMASICKMCVPLRLTHGVCKQTAC
eukprot:TRINITY_DN6619_c0_g1_i1.p1 TRINITY_DN6619_c0_g1~~TRINITY_DN6619_c0_g1_i1.p1  ORF type:complete len:788 (+),score=179.67 TRINITY_DN6619_c0_g1_i1:42-2366(+)